MCGRACLSLNQTDILCACAYKPRNSENFTKPDWLEEYNDGKKYMPSYNIAPSDVTPVLVSASKFKNATQSDRVIKPMMWGLIPPWHKGDYRTHNLSTNNCRLENIRSSKLYSPILKNGGRCIIVVEGFYEWQTSIKAKVKQPYYVYSHQDSSIKIDDPHTWNNKYNDVNGWCGVKLLYIAGIYDVWLNNETIIYSYSVITMESDSKFDWLHHRIPAILHSEEQINAWLDIDGVNPDKALAYLTPANVLTWHKVSTSVNNARNKSKDCNKKASLESGSDKKLQRPLTDWFYKGLKRNSINEISNVHKKPKK